MPSSFFFSRFTAITQECCKQYWTSPGSNTTQGTNYTATCLPSWKLYKLDEPDTHDTAGEARTNSSVMYSYGPPHMAKQKQDDQLERTYSSYVRIRDVVLKTCQRRWMKGRSGEIGSGISVLADDESKVADRSRRRPEGTLINTFYKEVLGRALLLSLDCSTLPSIRALYCWVLSQEVSSTIFKVFGMTRPGIKPRSPGKLANTLPTGYIDIMLLIFIIIMRWLVIYIYIYIYSHPPTDLFRSIRTHQCG